MGKSTLASLCQYCGLSRTNALCVTSCGALHAAAATLQNKGSGKKSRDAQKNKGVAPSRAKATKDVQQWTVAELREYCRRHSMPSSLPKDQLLAMVTSHRSSKSGSSLIAAANTLRTLRHAAPRRPQHHQASSPASSGKKSASRRRR